MQNTKCKMQNMFSAFRFPFSVFELYHPDYNRRSWNFAKSVPYAQQIVYKRHTGVVDYNHR